jgi:excinuclease UvrABC ATPase subunit
MKTTDPNLICPYTGLRSFTEEESLYFKGRDSQVDQVIDLLEQNKFLMVTGASGEGKSSLIYGGLIPNARAGFF